MNSTITTLFSVPVSKICANELLRAINKSILQKRVFIALPMNIHILTRVAHNPSRLVWYKLASCIFADGIPLLWLSKFKNQPLPERVSGTDLVENLLHKKYRTFLLGSTPDILLRMKSRYNTGGLFPIVGTYSPSYVAIWGKKELNTIAKMIKKTKAQIVLVGVGHPKQERWIIENYKSVSANVFIAVGSAFDILTGITPRAPEWLQKLGLEWVWRIALEPQRLALRYAKDIILLMGLLEKTFHHALLMGLFVILGFVLFFSSQTPPVQYRADKERSGRYSANLFHPRPEWWRQKTNGLLTSAPIVANGKLYVSSWESDTLFSYNEHTGDLLWSFVAQDDLPFSPSIYNHIVYIGSVDGRVYALDENNGNVLWSFESEKRKSFTSHPLITDNKIIISSRDGNLYSLDLKSGRQIWKFTTGGMLESSPIEYKGVLYFGSFDGKIYGVSLSKGKKVWEYKTEGKILSSPSLSDNMLVIGSNDSFVYAIDLNNKSLMWKTQTNGPIDATATIANNSVYINSLKNEVYALQLKNGKIRWKKSIPAGAHAGFAVDRRAVYFGSSNGSIYALNPQTGKTLWEYKTTLPITSAPTIVKNNIFVTSGQYVYVLNKNDGKPYKDPSAFQALSIPKKTNLHEPIELSIQHDDGLYENPWYEASVSATFVSESGTVMNVDGFYYDRNQWRVRFAPPELGKWSWTVFVRPTPSSERSKSGSFLVTPSDNPGFIRISTNNPLRLAFPDGSLFHPIGIGDKILDNNYNNYPLDDFASDVNNINIDIADYAKIFGKNGAGFNTFRWSIDNAAFPMWESNYNYRSGASMLWETYPERYGLWGDELVQTLRSEGFHIWLTLWGFVPNVGMEKDKEFIYNQPSLEAYVRYVVARYGAYVDIWELSNEAMVKTEWIKFVTTILRRLDPYHHPITVNWERPDLPEIDITSLHWYENEPLWQSDTAIIQEINKYKKWGKPIVFGEQGNKYTNWDELSGARMRIRLWTAFFNDTSIIFWNTSGTKNYTSKNNANIYLGGNERIFIRVFSDFVSSAAAMPRAASILTNSSNVRSYALQSNNEFTAYLFHFDNSNQTTTTSVSFTLQKDADVVWISPENGKELQSLRLPSGYHTIISPPFATDIALRAKLIQ